MRRHAAWKRPRKPLGRLLSRTAALLLALALAVPLLVSCGKESSASVEEIAETAEPSSSTPAPVPKTRKSSNVPMTKLQPGQKPPQFVLFSFDGVGVNKNWDEFLAAADETDARFTALMTGLYFLTDKAKRRYRGPGHQPGESSLAFGGTKAEVIEQVEYLNRTWYDGHEMGTHYVGHFCAGTKHPGKDWTTKDWNHELDQFFSLMTNWRRNTGIVGGPDLAFGTDVVKGGRTQCLEGSPATLFPALKQHGMTWDSSMPADKPGIFWPTKSRASGIWEFPIPYIYSPALRANQTALDYNFWFTFNGAKNAPNSAPKIRRIVKQTYDYMYKRAFEGNRAPLVIANHFNDWSGNAFNPATVDFMRGVCANPETICATYQDVIAWMEMQDPAVIKELQKQAPVATGPKQ